jgi:hypothetical protein
MQDFVDGTALPSLSSLSLPITDPGIPSDMAPMPPTMSACRRFISKFVIAIRSFADAHQYLSHTYEMQDKDGPHAAWTTYRSA